MADPFTLEDPHNPRVPKKGHYNLVHVYVGQQQHHFILQERPLREVSGLVAKALTAGNNEIMNHTVSLVDEDPASFEMFVHWLYFRKLPVVVENEAKDAEREYLELAKAWGLGKKLQCPKFQNDVLDALVARRNEDYDAVNIHPLSETVEYVYSHTTKLSMLRNFVADMYLQEGFDNRVCLWEDPRRIPLPLLLAITDTLFDARDVDYDWRYTDAWNFHV
ncbi:hypothetical protein BJY00DRAFT_320295 [Aspergillus carlsbadensis]|nr:hypothetical protein BJY00DRAFT_320295 [Aspergillus carlsbadensis]